MTTQAMIGHGTLFQIFDEEASPPGWVSVAEVTNVTPPTLARDTVDVTHTESEEKWRESIAGLKDPGEVQLEFNFIPKGPGLGIVLRSFNSDRRLNSRIIFPDGDWQASPPTASIWSFLSFCTNVAPAAPVDDKMSATCTFKLSGKPTFLAA
jgi:predicted secreted protein